MKVLSLSLLLSLVALLSPAPAVYGADLDANAETQEETAKTVDGRELHGRGRFHDDYDDDYFEHNFVDDYYDNTHPDHVYLPLDVVPFPFQNCVPESFRIAQGRHGPGHSPQGIPSDICSY